MIDVLLGIAGVFTVLAVLFLLSENKKKIKVRTIGTGLALYAGLAYFLVSFPLGKWIIEKMSAFVSTIFGYADEGISFVFGDLAGQGVFVIDTLMIVIFLSALISILQYLGVVTLFIRVVGGAIGKIMGTEKAESFVATANIFMGQSEAPLVVGKFMNRMTNSELMVVIVAGMGSISGSILAGYAGLGIPMEYLLTACALVPVGALIVSKMLVPQVKPSEVEDEVELDSKGNNTSVFSAMAEGINSGLQLVLAVMASLIAGISLVAMLNGGLGFIGTSIEEIFGYVLMPLGLLMGLPVGEAMTVGQLLGVKMTVNEFVAFAQLGEMAGSLSDRAYMMLSISLAGFANFSSIAIVVVGLAVFAPDRKNDLSKLALRGMIGGMSVSILSAMIVGLFI